LDICRKGLGEDHPHTAASYNNVAANLNAQGKYAAALQSLETAARSYETARLGIAAAGLERAAFGAERSPYPALAAACCRAGLPADAWAALEANLARGLLDEMALRRGAGLPPTERQQRDELLARRTPLETRILALVSRPQRRASEDAETKRLLGQRQELEKSLADLAVIVSRREVAALDQLQSALPADAAFVAWVDVTDQSGAMQEHWGCVVRPKGDPRLEQLPGSGSDGKWSKEDSNLPLHFREALARSAPAAEIDALAKKLHAQRLAPLSKHLAGVQRLFIAPVNQMAGIPMEALKEQYAISYTPSGTYLARLKDRPPPRGTRLLAVGDPLFPPTQAATPPTALPPGGLLITQVLPGGNAAKSRLQAGDVLVSYAGQELTSLEQLCKLRDAHAGDKSVLVQVWREGQEKLAKRELAPGPLGVALAKEPAREAITARRQADQLLAKLSRGDDFDELPGTQVEIARLAALFDAKSVTALTRDQASEQRLDRLRRDGKLKQFRYLHFATHGKANNARAFDSALILTRPAQMPEPRVGEPYLDGRLTAAEVLEYWQLDAELVTLSACESGLGRQGGGDGLLGFAQSFLLAGSRSVCLSLWQVDDTATALLMDRFYRNLLGKREDGAKAMGKAAALREAKQWLRNVPASEALARLGEITKGVVRGERPAREEMRAVPRPKDAAGDYKPYGHPRYWAAFILLGDPQ
jgi:CHAT domain-containing protein